jgi:hypothetical protein
MAPLPHNNTAIYFVDYLTGSVQHTMEWRYNGVFSPASFGTLLDDFLSEVSALTCALTVVRVRSQANGANVSFPVTTGQEGATFGSGTAVPDQIAASLNFVGRSSGGRRVRLSVFGYDNAVGDFRLTTTDSTVIDNAVTILTAASGVALAIDGVKPTWYPYANVSVNAYWQRQLRA